MQQRLLWHILRHEFVVLLIYSIDYVKAGDFRIERIKLVQSVVDQHEGRQPPNVTHNYPPLFHFAAIKPYSDTKIRLIMSSILNPNFTRSTRT